MLEKLETLEKKGKTFLHLPNTNNVSVLPLI